MASEIRVDTLKNTLGIGTITLSPTGQELLGITTTSVLKVTDETNSTSSTTGALIVTGGVGIAASLNVAGSVSIGGTLTYEDVTNVDAVGLITARDGIVVGSGITLSKDGDIFFTGIMTGNGSGLTGVANTDVIFTDKITLPDSAAGSINVGLASDLQIFHNGTDSIIQNTTGNLIIGDTTGNVILQGKYGEDSIICKPDAAVEINHDNTKVFETVSGGIKIHGTYEVNWAGGSSTYWWNNGDLVSTSSWVATKGGSGGNLVNTLGGTNGLTYSSSDSIFNGYKSLRMASTGTGGLRTSTEGSGTYWNGTEAWTVMAVFEQNAHSGGGSYGDGLFCQNTNDSGSTNNSGSWSVAPYGDHTWGGAYGEQFGYTGGTEPLANMTQPIKGIFMYRTLGFEHSELSVNLGGGWFPIALAHSAPSSLGTTFKNISFFNFMENSTSHNFIGGLAEMAYWKGTRVSGKELESISSYLCNKYAL